MSPIRNRFRRSRLECLDDILVAAGRAVFNWTLLGTHTGPDGTGKRVSIGGMEVCDLGSGGLIATSRGYYDTATYARQLSSD